jgi:hypothetical protein
MPMLRISATVPDAVPRFCGGTFPITALLLGV